MPKRFLSLINLVNLASDPASGSEGDIYWKSDTNKLRVYNGSAWADISGGAVNSITGTANEIEIASSNGDYTIGLPNDVTILSNLTVNGDISSANSLQLDTTTAPASAVGRILWDDGEGTATMLLKGGNVNLRIGQQNVILSNNGTGSTINKGSVVYISGAQGQKPSITLSDADTEMSSSKTLGIVAENILNGADGFVTTFGIVTGLDTFAFTAGDALWLSSTAGGLTATKPTQPAHAVFVGYCLHSHATAGRIFVNPQNGYELQELHNVLISSVANNDLLVYESSSSLWKNKSFGTLDLATRTGAETLTNKTLTTPSIASFVNATHNHTDSTNGGTLTASAITDFTEASQDAVGNSVGTGLTYNDTSGAISVDTTTIQVRVADVSDAEIGYLNGVTSAIQTQIDTKLSSSTAATTYAPIASPTFTGTVTLPSGTVTSTMIADGTIVNADISASAAIDKTKISGTAITASDTSTVTNTMLAGSIDNNKLTNSTISGVALGSNLNALTIGTGLSGTSYNGSSAVTIAIDSTVATLTGTQTLTNKTLTTPTMSTVGGDEGGQIEFGLAATNTTLNNSVAVDIYQDKLRIFETGGSTRGVFLNLASASNGVGSELVTNNSTQTLTNKTITSPIISGLSISDGSFIVEGATANEHETTVQFTDPTADRTITIPDVTGTVITTGDSGTVTSTMIADGTIVNGDISASAAIDKTKISGTAITAADTGTVTSAMIANGSIVNDDINASAAIALSKLATDPLARANHTGTQTASTISDFDTQVRTSRLDQMAAPTASVSMNSQKITSLATPTNSTDAATKAYVDGVTEGLHIHEAARVYSASNINLSNQLEAGDVIDGVTLIAGDRVLVNGQTSKSQNGIYVVQSSGAAVRATDFDSPVEIASGDFIFVSEGTTYNKTGWVQINSVGTVGTDDIEFTQFSGAGTYLAGNGLTLTGNSFSINTSITADLSTAQTLTNKTLTTPTLTLSSTTSTTSGRIAFDATNDKIVVGDGTNAVEFAPSTPLFNAQAGAYTLVLTDKDKIVEVGNASAVTLSVPTDASVAFPVGTQITILQTGAGQVTVAAVTPGTTTVNATPGAKLRAQWSSATLIKRAANSWVLVGDLTS